MLVPAPKTLNFAETVAWYLDRVPTWLRDDNDTLRADHLNLAPVEKLRLLTLLGELEDIKNDAAQLDDRSVQAHFGDDWRSDLVELLGPLDKWAYGTKTPPESSFANAVEKLDLFLTQLKSAKP